jgi:hypothetical protein
VDGFGRPPRADSKKALCQPQNLGGRSREEKSSQRQRQHYWKFKKELTAELIFDQILRYARRASS